MKSEKRVEKRPSQAAYHREKRALVLHEWWKAPPYRTTKTTIAMERLYWVALEAIGRRHGHSWRSMVTQVLMRKPDSYRSRAGWLRYYIIGYWILGPRAEKGRGYHPTYFPKEGWSLRKLKARFRPDRSL
ncbi:MAG: hypothetical protein ABL962_09450 [Fimbriimonadaceae bacterium]